MNGFGILLILVIIALPVVWLVAEFKASRGVRIGLGACAFACAIIFTYGLATLLSTLNYNATFGRATKSLVETSIAQIEDGHLDLVLKAWRALDAQYRPTYENRGGYQGLVESATRAMGGEPANPESSAWDIGPFNAKTWIGHWEDDFGFWILINDLDRPFDVTRSGAAPVRMHSVTVTEDHRVLKFKEGERFLHTLTIKNKYEASHEWFNLEQQKVWRTDSLHKLRRASDAEKAVTQQPNASQSGKR